MSLYIKGDIRCGVNGYKTLILMQDGSVTDTDGDIIGKAIEVPPCGRLGDLDELERMFADIDNAPYSGFDGAEPFYSAGDAAQIIRLAPTIIPASGGEEADPADPVDLVVAEALKHGFYGTMYGQKYAKGDKLIFIKPGEAWASNDVLFFRWGYPGPDVNTYKPEGYGKTWALTEAELTESIQSDPADKEGGE